MIIPKNQTIDDRYNIHRSLVFLFIMFVNKTFKLSLTLMAVHIGNVSIIAEEVPIDD